MNFRKLRQKSAKLPAPAATYHVSQRAPKADDAGPGSPEQPFKNLAPLKAHLKPGDTAIVHAGVYRESLILVDPNPKTGLY